MEWNDLKVFLAVAKAGSLGGAARLLKQSQPTMGRRLAALESDLGRTLFQRTTQGMVLTEDGAKMLGHVEKMEAEANGILRQGNVNPLAMEGTLKVSSSEWFGTYVLAQVLAEFARLYPRVKLELRTDHRFPNLDRREVDIAFRIVPFDEPDIVARRVLTMPYAVYQSTSRQDPQAGNGEGTGIITLTTNFTHLPDGAWFRQILPQAEVVFRSNNREVQAQMCREGLGVALLPCPLGDQFPELRRVDLGVPPSQDTWLGYHKDQSRSPLVRAFVKLALDRLPPSANPKQI